MTKSGCTRAQSSVPVPVPAPELRDSVLLRLGDADASDARRHARAERPAAAAVRVVGVEIHAQHPADRSLAGRAAGAAVTAKAAGASHAPNSRRTAKTARASHATGTAASVGHLGVDAGIVSCARPLLAAHAPRADQRKEQRQSDAPHSLDSLNVSQAFTSPLA